MFIDVKRISILSILFFAGILCLGKTANAQITYRVQHQSPTVVDRNKPVELTFEVPGINPGRIQDAFLFYKYDGEISYQQIRAEFNQGIFNVEFSIENDNAGMLEYYFSAEMNDGQIITYPANNPVQVDIVESKQEIAATSDKTQGIEYTILSPEPGAELIPSDVLIAITLFYEESAVDTSSSSFKLMFDGKDVTEQAGAAEYFFSYVPEEISPGEHQAVLQLETPDETFEIAGWIFTVLTPSEAAEVSSGFGIPGQTANTLVPRGQVELAARNQEVGGLGNDVARGNIRLSGGTDNIRYSAYGLLTSEESSRLQPQNRYGAELYVGDWLEVQAGHIYPRLSRLGISGRRVQGINTAIHFLKRGINLQFLYGKINRSISNIYNNISQNIISGSDGTPIDTTYSLSFDEVGTFKRNVWGGRLGFGRGRNFEWGFNFLKIRDDTTSLTNITDYDELDKMSPGLDDNLSTADLNKLQSDPTLLNVNGNPAPKDNLIAGTDLMFSLFKNALEIRTEGSISLLNENISGGILDDNNSLGIDVDQDISNQLDKLSWLIIINENMSTLPFRFDVQDEDTDVQAFFPTGILASQSELNFNLPENNFRLQYRWIGPNYVSLANSTIRRDVAGYTVTDRFQLFQNRLYVTLGYENLNDNVVGNSDATTNTNTIRSNVSWYPIEQFLPRVSLGVMYRNRDNGVSLFNPYLSNSDAAIRNFELIQDDTLLTANPQFTNTTQLTTSISQQFRLLDITHDASLNVSFFNTNDEVFRYGDTKNTSLNLTLRSRLTSIPLNTNIGFNINTTETLGGLSDIAIFGFNAGGNIYLMDNKLNVSADLAITNNTIESAPLVIDDNGTADPEDDYFRPDEDASGNLIVDETKNNLFIIRAGAQYNLNENHAFLVDFNFTNVSDPFSELNPPNDHMLQARYVYRF